MSWEASWYITSSLAGLQQTSEKNQRASLSFLVNLLYHQLRPEKLQCAEHFRGCRKVHLNINSASKQSNEGLSFSCTNVLAFSCFWKEEPRSVSWCERERLDDLRSSSLRPLCGHVHPVKIPKSTQRISSIQLEILVHSFHLHRSEFCVQTGLSLCSLAA